jgi:hypothetical protein
VSRTHRAHLSPAKAAKRGGKVKTYQHDKPTKVVVKSHKQTRPNDRARLRKEYL